MALTNHGVDVHVDPTLLPSGYTPPTITTFNDIQYTRSQNFTVVRADVLGVDDATTFTNMVADINNQVNTILNADFDVTGRTVTAFTNFNDLTHDLHDTNTMYNGTMDNFYCNCTVFVKCQ